MHDCTGIFPCLINFRMKLKLGGRLIHAFCFQGVNVYLNHIACFQQSIVDAGRCDKHRFAVESYRKISPGSLHKLLFCKLVSVCHKVLTKLRFFRRKVRRDGFRFRLLGIILFIILPHSFHFFFIKRLASAKALRLPFRFGSLFHYGQRRRRFVKRSADGNAVSDTFSLSIHCAKNQTAVASL